MDNRKLNTLRFIRETYKIPKKFKLEWGVIEEINGGNSEYRLGVIIKGSRLFVDVTERRLRAACNYRSYKREIFPAKRTVLNRQQYCYQVEMPNGSMFHRIFSKDLMEHVMQGTVYEAGLEENPPL